MIQKEKSIEEQLAEEDSNAAKGCFIGGCISLSVCLIISLLTYLIYFMVNHVGK